MNQGTRAQSTKQPQFQFAVGSFLQETSTDGREAQTAGLATRLELGLGFQKDTAKMSAPNRVLACEKHGNPCLVCRYLTDASFIAGIVCRSSKQCIDPYSSMSSSFLNKDCIDPDSSMSMSLLTRDELVITA